MPERTMTIAEAARNLSDVVERARTEHESTLLVSNGTPVARVVPVVSAGISGRELARIWPTLPHLDSEDAIAFEAELKKGRRVLLPPRIEWE